MKVLLHIRSLDVGGSERQVVSLAKSMAFLGAEVHIAVTRSGGSLEIDLQRIPNIYLHHVGGSTVGNKVKYLVQLRYLIKSVKFDAVYGFLPVPNLALLVALTVRNRPCIAWGIRSSNLDFTQYNKRVKWTMMLEKWLSRFPDKIITNSRTALEEYRLKGYPYSKLQHIPNAIDAQRFKPDPQARILIRKDLGISKNAPLIGLFARIHPMKDHLTFLNAVKILIRQMPDARFICAGGISDGYLSLKNLIRSTAGNLKLDEHIFWLGSRNDPEQLIAACDITTLTSDSGEGFPNSIAESAASGVPCVATDVGDSSDILSNFFAVVPPRNPNALAIAWQSALEQDPIRRSQIAIKMRQSIVDRFSCEAIANRTLRTLHR